MPQGSPLAGKIFDAYGLSMTPAIAYGKSKRRYRCYVSQPLHVGQGAKFDREVVRRVAAGAIEGLVMERLTACELITAGAGREVVRARVESVTLGKDELIIRLHRGETSAAELAAACLRLTGRQRLIAAGGRHPKLDLVIPGRPVFRGGRIWIASPDGSSLARTSTVDAGLVGGLRKAHALIADGAEQGLSQSYHRYMARLAFLAPDIQQAIVEGRQPAGLTLERLLKEAVPLVWSEQRLQLGFSPVK